MRRLAALLVALAPATPGAAQQIVASPAAEAVSVTVYRDPERSSDQEIELDWLGGYALITETRTVDLPAGESVIRFEGVAGSMLPVSVAVSGLPRPLSEKNYDARLLSPGALVDASLGRQVHIRRTDRATGRTTEAEAILRSGPNGIVLQTAGGYEALRCTGLNETLVYAQAPADLADKPTLALRTSAVSPTRATLRLSYLAGQFDWQANYVAHLGRDGRTLDLFAWLTLANGNDESFPAAQTQAIAGTIERDEDADGEGVSPVSPEIHLQCWPEGNTGVPGELPPEPLPPPPAAMEMYEMTGEDIIVTGSRIRRPNLESSVPITVISAQQEELGDLKLYRIPEPVTVAANAQKQVALLNKARVPVERIYGMGLDAAGDDGGEPQPLPILLRMKNLKARGLGLPLPAGMVAMFEQPGERPMLIGEAPIRDHAIGEEVELPAGTSPEVAVVRRALPRKGRERADDADAEDDDDVDGDDPRRRYELVVTNARPAPVTVELELWVYGDQRLVRPSRKLGLKNGSRLWRVEVPANGRARLVYTLARERSADSRRDEEREEE